MGSWLNVQPSQIILMVYIQPGAKKSCICGEHNGQLKIKIAAPPVDGKANAELIEFLSKEIGCAKSSIAIVSGENSRTKKIAIDNLTVEDKIKKWLVKKT